MAPFCLQERREGRRPPLLSPLFLLGRRYSSGSTVVRKREKGEWAEKGTTILVLLQGKYVKVKMSLFYAQRRLKLCRPTFVLEMFHTFFSRNTRQAFFSRISTSAFVFRRSFLFLPV